MNAKERKRLEKLGYKISDTGVRLKKRPKGETMMSALEKIRSKKSMVDDAVLFMRGHRFDDPSED